MVNTANAATLATITNFEVTNAAAVKFVIAIPTNIPVGTPFGVKVTILDAYGNGVKYYFGTIHFGNMVGIAGLPADYAFNSADVGVHTFSLTLSVAGNPSISAQISRACR